MTRPLSYKPVKARLLGKNSSDQRERVLAVVRQHRLLGGPAAVSISALILAGLLAVVLGPAAATLGGESSPAEPASSSPAAAAEAQKSATVDEGAETKGWMGKVDREFGDKLVKPLTKVLFFDLWSSRWLRCVVPTEATCPECKSKFVVADTWPGESIPIVLTCPECGADIPTGNSVPLVVLWLFVGALFFTIRMGFINIRGFWHAVRVTKGDYDDPSDPGEVSHFQALASALSATVGLGNIAGVAIAVTRGGPGAIFWMVLAGLLGMSTKFAECTAGQLYRKVDPDGTVSGGPMHYLRDGLAEIKLKWPVEISFKWLGIVLGTVFAVVCMGGSFGGGCVFQVKQSLESLRTQVEIFDELPWIYGLILVVLAGVVIIGGIRRIAATAEKIVPLMCCLYVAASVYILVLNYDRILPAVELIFTSAFTMDAAYGGFLGVMVMGIRRAAFSNEAGLGSASIAHAAAKTDEPVSEGIVALLEPFIDTVVVCTMTGLVLVITGVYNNPDHAQLIALGKGAPLTGEAFRTVLPWFPWVLTAAVCLFAYSTLISWSYYGERCWSLLFGRRTSLLYKLIFLGFVFLGSIVTADNITDFSDLMILSMAFPNILGVMLLSGKIRRSLDEYWKRVKSGEIRREAAE